MKGIGNNQKGFTLIEIMMVVIIIGILAVLAIPRYQKYLIESKLAEVSVSVGEIKQGMEKYYNAHFQSYTGYSGEVTGLEKVLRIELGEAAKDHFSYTTVVQSSDGKHLGYILTAYLTANGETYFGGTGDQGDRVVYYFPASLNASSADAIWVKGWCDEDFFVDGQSTEY